MTTEHLQWFTSSYSNNGGQCVQVAHNIVAARGVVPVRDSKRLDGPVLDIQADAYSSFVSGVKAGSFDNT
ncbi:DUF397 domain-containing protein [Streptomyces sp. CBMA152]|uniref:DUF397 domain-containing protein n=1 Tax=Streptomyces sp. CBMA152 TaxID=1896312 RepID=UPI001660B3DD|nr:DUF397 domain-containing protein [Streptomyces sp. CBMA152]MBD0741419.1 DUF397 domain-containing protein [Streptomyces sp. CBMA152]